MKKSLLFYLVLLSSSILLYSQTTFAGLQNIDGAPGELITLDVGSLIGGTGYGNANGVVVTSNNMGVQATVNITTVLGVVTSVTINKPGAFYQVGETLTITGGNADATIDVLIVDEMGGGVDPTVVVSGDLDGDTDIDIVIGTYYYVDGKIQDYIKWYQNDGNGNFTLQSSVSESIIWVQGLIIADIDVLNTNGNDIIATINDGSKLVYFPNNGAGGFGSEVVISNMITNPGQVVSGDINNDGFLDLVTASYTNEEAIWFMGDGMGGFVEQTTSPIQTGGVGGPYYIDIADFDGDTDLDILVGFYNNGNIEIYYNQYIESGSTAVSWTKDTFTVVSGVSFLSVATNQIAFADVNNDGILDIIKSDNGTGDVEWFSKIKNGSSTPNAISNSTIIARPGTVAVADLDNDTYNDVILTDGASGDDSIIWFKGANNSSPDSTPNVVVDNNFQYWSITVNDFDGDTDKDIAAVGVFSNTLDWYENEWDLLGISDNSINKITIFPNPTKNLLSFKGLSEKTEVSVYDIVGKPVLNSTLVSNTPLDVSKLQSGIYILKFQDYNSTFKFIKE
jgi:hypothetical protein